MSDSDPSPLLVPPPPIIGLSTYREQAETLVWDCDAWEIALLTATLARDIPVLGAGRGLQVLNVALGGTLEQHVPDRVRHAGHQPGPGCFGTTEVDVEPDSQVRPRAETACST